MSMSTHVIGIRPPNEKWLKMKKVYDVCEAAGVSAPREVDEFFNDEEPDKDGVVVELSYETGVSDYNEEMENGYQIDITKLPKDVTIVRFVNSY